MKKTFNLFFVFCLITMVGSSAYAQTPYQSTGNSPATAGTVGLSVSIPKSSDLRTGGAAASNAGVNVAAQSNTNDALNVSLTFTDASPNQTNVSATAPFLTATVPLRMRSNADYEVYAFRAGTLNSVDLADFRAADVGFGVVNVVRPTGGLVAAGADTVTTGFNVDPSTATVTAGQPTYSKTLQDVDTNSGITKILTGNRISNGGDNTSTNNFISADMKFAVKPQYYTPGTYTETVKVYIVTP